VTAAGEQLLELSEVGVTFPGRGFLGRRAAPVQAVRGASLAVSAGETVGLVGESGCGKSTLGRAAVRLVTPDAGRVLFEGRDITRLPAPALRPVRRRLQMVFQDPYSSLDPSMTVVDSVGEPLRVHERLPAAARAGRVLESLELVGLAAHHLYRYPYEFSGGQRQRLALARALILDPRLVVCDEVTSALDVSTQNQILALLARLQAQTQVAFLFISHNLQAVRHVAARVAVMYLGKVVESGPTERVFTAPAHPYTASLLAAIPGEQRRRRPGATLPAAAPAGELPSPVNPPAGCPFHTRCPLVLERCRVEMPEPTKVDGGGVVACHAWQSGDLGRRTPLPG
jgi:oligopeptide/dipeptide ABC transporter ATP-binding protein